MPASVYNSISNPFGQGSEVLLPQGTVVHSTNPSKGEYVLKRSQTVTVHHCVGGYVNLDNYRDFGGRGFVYLPMITWPGTGGYWCDVQITPELCEFNGVPVPELPGQDGNCGNYALDVIPSYQDGYTNRWFYAES